MDDKRIHGKNQTSKQYSSLFLDMSVVQRELFQSCLGVALSFVWSIPSRQDFEDPLFTPFEPKFNFDFWVHFVSHL